MKKWIRIAVLILLALAVAVPAFAAAPAMESDDSGARETEGKSVTGLPLPRFASLRVGEINLRTGPGTRYPILWVFERQGMPVEITAEYEYWRRVRDADGDEGWVHKNALSGRRAALVTAVRYLRRDDDDASGVAARLEPNVTLQILACKKEWCRLKTGEVKGWLKKSDFWGAYPEETFD